MINKNYELMFTKNPLDRMDKLRGSLDDFFTSSPNLEACFILISEEKLIVHDNEVDFLFRQNELVSMGISLDPIIFLGVHDSIYYFTKSIDTFLDNKHKSIDLKSFAVLRSHNDQNIDILAQAFSILKWHKTHRFCPSCGTKNQIMQAGWRQDCPSCGKQHFPRTDPVVIMLVTHGDYCLLGAGPDFPQGLYSCLAGFMEPGETIEQATLRELFEEAGVVGLDVEYVISQPWPFPSSLMIGVQVHAPNMELAINHDEIVDARWVHKSEIINALNQTSESEFTLPPKIAIARTLLEYWVK